MSLSTVAGLPMVLLLHFAFEGMNQSRVAMQSAVREYTLEHPRPESRTQWRITDTYLSRQPYLRQNVEKASQSIIVIDAALPDMRALQTSGLNLGRRDDEKRHVSISLTASYDFALERRTLPRMLQDELEPIGEYRAIILKYRQVRRKIEEK
jgi:hypothetical protein